MMIFQIPNKSINLNGFGSIIKMMPKYSMLKALLDHFLCVDVGNFGKVLRLLVGKNMMQDWVDIVDEWKE